MHTLQLGIFLLQWLQGDPGTSGMKWLLGFVGAVAIGNEIKKERGNRRMREQLYGELIHNYEKLGVHPGSHFPRTTGDPPKIARGHESSLWKLKLGTTILVRFLCGFNVEIGDSNLSGPLLCEYPQRVANNRIVLNFVSTTVAKDQNRGSCLVFIRRSRVALRTLG